MMKKTLRTLLPVLALVLAAHAQAESPAHDDAHSSAQRAVKVRQVDYTCQQGKRLQVRYGFDKQGKPTYAQAQVNGKTRFMPINSGRTDEVSTVFGDENNFSLMAGPLTLDNYHKSGMNVQSPGSNITHKGCDARATRKIKG